MRSIWSVVFRVGMSEPCSHFTTSHFGVSLLPIYGWHTCAGHTIIFITSLYGREACCLPYKQHAIHRQLRCKYPCARPAGTTATSRPRTIRPCLISVVLLRLILHTSIPKHPLRSSTSRTTTLATAAKTCST